jgi:hypothetical protein
MNGNAPAANVWSIDEETTPHPPIQRAMSMVKAALQAKSGVSFTGSRVANREDNLEQARLSKYSGTPSGVVSDIHVEQTFPNHLTRPC